MKENDLRGMLKDQLSKEQLMMVPRSFDIIGSREKAVALIEIPEELKPHTELMAKALMRVHKNVKSVLVKGSERRGVYRLRDYHLALGGEDTEVTHKEYGCSFKLDPRTVYFSPRESTERIRIAEQVRPDETVLVMFSGVGPFPIIIAKRQSRVRGVYAVELNRIAHQYCMENVRLNKVSDKVTSILGDVKEVCPTLGSDFDRVLMPLPKGAHEFLDVAIPRLKEGGILHFYHWAPDRDPFSEAEDLVFNACKKLGRGSKVLDEVKVLPYGPRKLKVCLDVQVTPK